MNWTDIRLITWDKNTPEFEAIKKDIEEVVKKHSTIDEFRIFEVKPKGKYTIIPIIDLLKVIALVVSITVAFSILIYLVGGGNCA